MTGLLVVPDTAEVHRCCVCGGPLHFDFVLRRRADLSLVGWHVNCRRDTEPPDTYSGRQSGGRAMSDYSTPRYLKWQQEPPPYEHLWNAHYRWWARPFRPLIVAWADWQFRREHRRATKNSGS